MVVDHSVLSGVFATEPEALHLCAGDVDDVGDDFVLLAEAFVSAYKRRHDESKMKSVLFLVHDSES